jgi:hypothetical protein
MEDFNRAELRIYSHAAGFLSPDQQKYAMNLPVAYRNINK